MEKINVKSKIYEVVNYDSGFLDDVYLLFDKRRDKYTIATVCELDGESAQQAKRIASVYGAEYGFAANAMFKAMRDFASGNYSLRDLDEMYSRL